MRTTAYDTAESGDQFMINDDKIDFFQKLCGFFQQYFRSMLHKFVLFPEAP